MPIEPTLAEVIRGAIDGKLMDVHTALPGRVKSYDSAKQVADIIPAIRGVIFTEDDEPVLEDMPVIPNVPVAWMRGGGYWLQFPLNVGDHVLLVFSEAATGIWRTTGETSEPGDLRRHDLSHAFAIPCIAPDASTLPAIGNEAVIDGPAMVRLGGPAADFVALTTKVTAALTALKSAIASAPTVPQDGGSAFKAALVSALASWPPPLGATKVKAE